MQLFQIQISDSLNTEIPQLVHHKIYGVFFYQGTLKNEGGLTLLRHMGHNYVVPLL